MSKKDCEFYHGLRLDLKVNKDDIAHYRKQKTQRLIIIATLVFILATLFLGAIILPFFMR